MPKTNLVLRGKGWKSIMELTCSPKTSPNAHSVLDQSGDRKRSMETCALCRLVIRLISFRESKQD